MFLRIILDFHREYRIMRTRGYDDGAARMRAVHEKRARKLYRLAVRMGGVMIKLCQYFSTRRDIFPEEYVRILSPLQDSVPAAPFDAIEEVLAGEYGDWRARFSSVDETPLASASLGQVHRAVLTDGSHVVIKVLKPGIERVVDIDCAILTRVFTFLSRFRVFTDHADFMGLLDEFITVTGDEMNFRREAAVAQIFRESLKKFPYVRVPQVHGAFTTRRVIVMEYLEGDKITSVEAWSARNNDPALIARRITELYFEQILFMPYIHFDPHPGNILVTDESRLVLLDFGMTGAISEHMRRGLSDVLEGFVARDYRKIIDTLYTLGFIRKNVNRYAMLPVIEYVFDDLLDGLRLEREALYTLDLSPVKEQLVEIIYTQPFNIPLEWAYIGKTVSTVVGVIAKLNPEFNAYAEIKPHVERFIKGNVPRAMRKVFENVKSTAAITAGLPHKMNAFLDNLEKGYYRIRVDYTEIIEKIDEFKVFLLRAVAAVTALACGISAFVFQSMGLAAVPYLFGAIAVGACFFSLFYRKPTAREKIRRYLS